MRPGATGNMRVRTVGTVQPGDTVWRGRQAFRVTSVETPGPGDHPNEFYVRATAVLPHFATDVNHFVPWWTRFRRVR